MPNVALVYVTTSAAHGEQRRLPSRRTPSEYLDLVIRTLSTEPFHRTPPPPSSVSPVHRPHQPLPPLHATAQHIIGRRWLWRENVGENGFSSHPAAHSRIRRLVGSRRPLFSLLFRPPLRPFSANVPGIEFTTDHQSSPLLRHRHRPLPPQVFFPTLIVYYLRDVAIPPSFPSLNYIIVQLLSFIRHTFASSINLLPYLPISHRGFPYHWSSPFIAWHFTT